MNNHERNSTKPPFSEIGGHEPVDTLPLQPPFDFDGVTVIIFPLRASIARLSDFCEQYLELDKEQKLIFKPAAPYVFLMVLDYGRMATEGTRGARNLGWVSQHEVTFTVPLECWKWSGSAKGEGKLEFQDWAGVSPFIYVDDQVSLTTGREIYGWPKVAGKVESLPSLWDNRPTESSRVFRFSTHTLPRVFTGKQQTLQVLLEVDFDPLPTFSVLPSDPASPWAPWNAIGKMTTSYLSLMGNVLDVTLGLRLRGFPPKGDIGEYLFRGTKRAIEYLGDGTPLMGQTMWWNPILWGRRSSVAKKGVQGDGSLRLKNITLKQFRDAARPHMACYQALVESSMGVERVSQSGMLGDFNMLRGDSSGGYSIRIHNSLLHPIIDSLGLEVDHIESVDDKAHVSVLKPFFPYWSEFDLNYGQGKVIYSHSLGLSDPPEYVSRKEKDDFKYNFAYNSILGTATQPVEGPFHIPDVTLQVYPLHADAEKLKELVSNYFFKHKSHRFEPEGNYVYLIVRVVGDEYGKVWSPTRNVEWWHDQSVQVSIPVKYYLDDKLISSAFFTPYVFANSGLATISDREVNGRPTLKATIESPPDVWLEPSGPVQPRHFLRLSTEVFKSFGEGERATEQTLIEIDAAKLLNDCDTDVWVKILKDWLPTLLEDGKRKLDETQQAEAPMSFSHDYGFPLNSLTLKQYRDAEDVTTACYQAIVTTKIAVKHIYASGPITEPVHVRLHRFPSLPIADTLGLTLKHVDTCNEREVIQILQPLNPFWLRVSIEEDLGKVIAKQSESNGFWHIDSSNLPINDSDQAVTEIPPAEPDLQKILDHFSLMARANQKNYEDEIRMNIDGYEKVGIQAHAFGPLGPRLAKFNSHSSTPASSFAEFYDRFLDYLMHTDEEKTS